MGAPDRPLDAAVLRRSRVALSTIFVYFPAGGFATTCTMPDGQVIVSFFTAVSCPSPNSTRGSEEER